MDAWIFDHILLENKQSVLWPNIYFADLENCERHDVLAFSMKLKSYIFAV